ncbi:MAG: hypothetical protein J6S85_20040 [Methanobrevibacter sp.]|nr:hypothetical protein [Methanobrevibacter sp.]
MEHISISKGNDKMGAISSVSLPPIVTCSAEACKFCAKKCYAAKIARLRKTVRDAYARNLRILLEDPETYWREVNAAVALVTFFRFHVSGDIYNEEYLENMVKVAENNKHCQILCFTKKFSLCNNYLKEHGSFPSNLHIIYSGWREMTMDNPFNQPEAHVLYKDGFTTAKDGAFYCSHSCFECAVKARNCWALQQGQQIIFKEH